MSDLFRKEAINKRARGLFGEVRLQAPPGSWIITVLIVALVGILMAGLFLLQVQTEDGPIRLIDWLRR